MRAQAVADKARKADFDAMWKQIEVAKAVLAKDKACVKQETDW